MMESRLQAAAQRVNGGSTRLLVSGSGLHFLFAFFDLPAHGFSLFRDGRNRESLIKQW